MPTRAAVLDPLLRLAWSQWTALGVAGAVQPAREPIDLESLLILTAELASDDPRLRDESLDWCSQFHGYLSKPRLKQLLRRASPSAQAAFGIFAGALERHAGGPWPGALGHSGEPTVLSGKSRLPPLTREALLGLRLRALFGVGARADIVGAKLCSPLGKFSASDLVFVGYTKRNIADALNMLTAAGLFRASREGNRIRFLWQRHAQLSALVEPLPRAIPLWSLRMRIMSGLLAFSPRLQGKSDRLARVEAALFFRSFADELRSLGIEPPELTPSMTNGAVSSWALATLEGVVSAQHAAPAEQEATVAHPRPRV